MVQSVPQVQSQTVTHVNDFKPNNFHQVKPNVAPVKFDFGLVNKPMFVRDVLEKVTPELFPMGEQSNVGASENKVDSVCEIDLPLGHVVGQVANKYIIAQKGDNMVIVDQHAGHERITYEKLRNGKIKSQPLLAPIVIKLREEDVSAVISIADDLKKSGLI